MGVALPLPGRGGASAPHESILTLLSKIISTRFMPARALFRMHIPCCRGRGASSPTNQNPHIQKSLRYFLKIFSTRSYARKGITWDATSHVAGGVGRAAPQNKHTHFYARKAQFGIKRPAFTRGHRGDASPHIRSVSPAKPRSLYARKGRIWDATSYVAGGVGRVAPQNKHTHLCARKAQFGCKDFAVLRG